MFLKTQEDLHALFKLYPEDRYFIKVQGGKTDWFPKDEVIFLHKEHKIEFKNNKLILSTRFGEKNSDFDYGIYEYSLEGIRVLFIHENIKSGRNPMPIMVNGEMIIDKLQKNNQKKLREFYLGIEKISRKINFLRDQHMVIKGIQDINGGNFINQDSINYLTAYFKNTSAYHSMITYRSLLDEDTRSLSFLNIIKEGTDMGFILSSEDNKLLNNFKSDSTYKHVNKFIAHIDKNEYMNDSAFSPRISDGDKGGIKIQFPIYEHVPILGKLDELFDFIENIFDKYYAYNISQHGRTQKNFTLTLNSIN